MLPLTSLRRTDKIGAETGAEPMQERVRICDIAEELGLSTATVSNVIHGKTNKVSDETVQRVTALLEKRRYIPSMAGILLARNSSGIIGVFVNDHPKYEGHTLRDGFLASALLPLFVCEASWSLGENVYAAIYGRHGHGAKRRHDADRAHTRDWRSARCAACRRLRA